MTVAVVALNRCATETNFTIVLEELKHLFGMLVKITKINLEVSLSLNMGYDFDKFCR